MSGFGGEVVEAEVLFSAVRKTGNVTVKMREENRRMAIESEVEKERIEVFIHEHEIKKQQSSINQKRGLKKGYFCSRKKTQSINRFMDDNDLSAFSAV